MSITDRQYRRLMKTYNETGSIARGARDALMDRKTAAKYVAAGCGPQSLRVPHTWRTREDPIEAIWPEAVRWLEEVPELEAKALFEHLTDGTEIEPGALRTFQRRIRRWRRMNGPPKEVSFPQHRLPGESMQFDWTHATQLEVTIAGAPYPHLLAHAVLPFSNWQWAVPCLSESTASLLMGVQAAYWELGAVTKQLQTDQSSTATHQLHRGSERRVFNERYLALCEHLGVTPRTIAVGCPDQNGDVESAQGHLKRRLHQHLLLRGSRDFPTLAEYGRFVAGVCTAANRRRHNALALERPHLRPLPPTMLPLHERFRTRVSSASTARVKGSAYSVPSRLIGSLLDAYLSDCEVVFSLDGQEVLRCPKAMTHQPRIDYRHVIDTLIRKPGALDRYIYREELFPGIAFRQCFDRLRQAQPQRANAHYLAILKLASQRGEADVSHAIRALLREQQLPTPQAVINRLNAARPAHPPGSDLRPFTPQLAGYDALILQEAAS